MRTSINLLLALLLCIVGISCKLAENNNDFYFLQWNKVTLASIEKDAIESPGIDEKSLYKNRFEAFNSSESLAKIKESVRHEFWQTLGQNNISGKNFYIIETVNSGEMVTFENMVIYLDQGDFVIDVYRYNPRNQKWIKYKPLRKPKFSLDRQQNKVVFHTGLIHDDIIVSKFQGLKGLSVDYYVSTTVNKKGGINVLLLK
jgi:hypothetical protein